jgi:hypothetical protein
MPPIQRWLNRILALPIALQNNIFDEFLSLIETRVSAAREAGRLDVGVETILVDKATLIDDVVLRTDPRTGATSHLLTIEIARRRNPVSLERILRIADGDAKSRLLRNRSSRVAALMHDRTRLMDDGTPVARFTLHRPWWAKLAHRRTRRATGMIDARGLRAGLADEAEDRRPNPTERFYSRPAASADLERWAMRRRSTASSPKWPVFARPHCARRSGQHAAHKLGIGDPEALTDAAPGGTGRSVVPIDPCPAPASSVPV